MRKILTLGVICVLAVFLFDCKVTTTASKKGPESEKENDKKDERVPVEVAFIGRGAIEAVIRASTNLEADARVEVFSRSTNLVAELLVEEGDAIAENQLLLRLENQTQKIQLNKAEVRLDKARKEFKRKQDLVENELISIQEFNDATYELKQAELQLAEAQQELDYTQIRAPIKGTLTSRMIKLGDQVNVGQHLFDIIDFDSLIARVYVPEKDLSGLGLGQKARLRSQAMGDRPIHGVIQRIAPTVDPKTGTVKVTVKVDRVAQLRPGMYVDLDIVVNTHEQALLIPKKALVYDQDQVFVFRVIDDGEQGAVVERVAVNPQLMDQRFVEPGAGFSTEDRIVVAGQSSLKDHAAIKILRENGITVPEQAPEGGSEAGTASGALK